MKKFLFVVIAVILFGGMAWAADINIDVTNSSMAIVNGTTIRIHNVSATSTDIPSGNYWADFQWDAVNYLFFPVNYAEESQDPTVKAEMLSGQWFLTEKMLILFAEEINFTGLVETPTLPSDTKCMQGFNSSGGAALGCYYASLSTWIVVSLNSSTATFDDSFVFNTNGEKITAGGCYFLNYRSDGHLSNCYPLYGFKNSMTPRVLKAALSADTKRQQQKESILQQSVEYGDVDSNIVSAIANMRALLN